MDSLRGATPIKSEDEYEYARPFIDQHLLADVDRRPACREYNEPHGFSPKIAMTTFRQHVQIGSSKSRQRRGALADICGNAANTGGADGMENQEESDMSPEKRSSPRGHSKTLSLGRNIVGSIRGMASRHSRSPPKDKQNENSPPRPVSSMATPSAPALTLDLGVDAEEGLVPKDFGHATRLTRNEEMLTLARTDSAFVPAPHFKSGAPLPIEPGVLARNPFAPPTDDNISVAETVDSKQEHPSEVFERSVDTKSSKSLKRMISLDAMAEKCTKSPVENYQTVLLKTKVKGAPSSRYPSPSTTISTCLSDMQELSRQPARLQIPTVLLEGQVDESKTSDDPFAACMPSIELYGPEVELPFRPKDVAEEENVDLSSLDGHVHTNATVPSVFDSAKKHRSMVSKVLDLVGESGRMTPQQVLHTTPVSAERDFENFARRDPGSWNWIDPTEREEVTIFEQGFIPLESSPTPSEKTCSSDSAALREAISDNYELQVAMGGVDITWGKEKMDISPIVHEYEALIDKIGSGSEGSSERALSESEKVGLLEKVDSLDEALDMYRTYSAKDGEHAVGKSSVDMESPSSPESPSSMKRALPSRYRVKGGRRG